MCSFDPGHADSSALANQSSQWQLCMVSYHHGLLLSYWVKQMNWNASKGMPLRISFTPLTVIIIPKLLLHV